MSNRVTRWWRAFKLGALRNFGAFIWWVTSAGFFYWNLCMFLLLLIPPYNRSNPTLQEWFNYQIGTNAPLLTIGLFFCGLGFLVSLLIDIVVALSHSRQIKTALFQVLNHQSYSDSLQPVLDEATSPVPPSQASAEYVRIRRWISDRVTHDLAPGEAIPAPSERAIWRRFVKHVYRSSAFIGLFATSFYTMRGFAEGGRSWPQIQPVINALFSAAGHASLGFLLCGLFLLIYTLITWGDHVREENRERVNLLYELTGSAANTSTHDAQEYHDTLGLHSLEEEEFQAAHSSHRE